MKKVSTLILGFTLLGSHYASANVLRIDNVRLYQPHSQSFSQPSRLYIQDDKIIEVTSLTVAGKDADQIVNANNQYGVAGLTDLHVHLGASGSSYSNFQYLPVATHFNSNLYLGVTNIVDLFSVEQTLQQADQLKQTQATPNLFYAGSLFTNPGGHGTQFGGGAREIATDDDIASAWQQHMAAKPSVTKAVIETFGGRSESLTDSQLALLGKRSKAAGLPYFVHVSTLQDAKRAIKAGATALAHGINDEPVDDDFVQLMIEHQVAYIPTLAVYFNPSAEREHQAISKQTHLLATVPEKLQQCLFGKGIKPTKGHDNTSKNRRHAQNNIMRLHKAGVIIGTGSDAGNPYTLHGTALHNEIQALRNAGLSAAQTINAATINSANILGRQKRIGQLAPGFEASFILVKDNPLTDITNLGKIATVYKSGQKINRAALITANQQIQPRGKACQGSALVTHKATRIIDDFSGDVKWQAISDQMMGGQSTARIEQVDGEFIIHSRLAAATTFGAWAGSQLEFSLAQDASDYQGIEITYLSSDSPIGLSVYHSEVKDWDHFSTLLQPSAQWRTVQIPFSELKQFGFGERVNWSAKSLSGINFVWRNMSQDKPLNNENRVKLSDVSYY
jgi:imidazolonepropionase-like amidohydrolase